MSRISENFFKNPHTILYIGKNVSNEDIKKYYAVYNWKCVITCKTDAEFDDCFKNSVSINDVETLPEFSFTRMPVVRLFGMGDNLPSKPTARIYFASILKLLQAVHSLVAVGITEEEAWIFKSEYVYEELKRINGKRISFFCTDPKIFDFYQDEDYDFFNIEDKFGFHSENPANIIEKSREKAEHLKEEYPELNDYSVDFYYRDHKPVQFIEEDFRNFKTFGTILTFKTVNQHIGTRYIKDSFIKFLENSSTFPQWYGYRPDLNFYVERQIEKELLEAVKNGLDKNNMTFVLRGDSGSSKSVILASVAYRIFGEENNPVVYITEKITDDLKFDRYSDYLNETVEKLQGAENKRVLIVWDHSVADIKSIQKIENSLEKVGRRFVLLCCGYKTVSAENSSRNLKIFDVERSFSVEERNKSFELIKKYTDIDFDDVAEELKGCDDIFLIFYTVIKQIRRRLRIKIRIEHKSIYDYVIGKITDLSDNKKAVKRPNSDAILEQFKKLGLVDENCSFSKEKDENSEDMKEQLDDFNLAIAMFSQAGLELPADIAYHIFFKSDDLRKTIYSDSNMETFRALSNIPWLRYNDSNDNLSFSFRIPLEAGFFIEDYVAKNPGNKWFGKRFELLEKIIKLYSSQAKTTRLKDLFFTYNLQMMLRNTGPNSSEYKTNEKFRIEFHNKITQNVKKLILVDDSVSETTDNDGGFSAIYINFVREYYKSFVDKYIGEEGSVNGETTKKATDALNDAIDNAVKRIDSLDNLISGDNIDARSKKYNLKQRNTLINEVAICNNYLKKLGYDKPLPYDTVCGYLRKAISSNRFDSYLYGSLFDTFCTFYDSFKDDQEKLENFIKIFETINEWKLLKNNDSQESKSYKTVNRKIEAIKDITSHLPEISIDSISKGKTEPFDMLYQNRKSDVIVLACYKELERIQDVYHYSPDTDRATIEKVYMFMSENYSILKDSSNAMNLLIRVAWMYFSGYTLDSKKERQLTKISVGDWKELKKYCEVYSELLKDSPEYKQPDICLLYVLSICQINYFEKSELLNSEKVKGILLSDDWFDDRGRMRTPFVLCDDDKGKPLEFIGVVEMNKLTSDGGKMSVEGHPMRLRFRNSNIGRDVTPNIGDRIKIHIGIGYAGFSACICEGGNRQL